MVETWRSASLKIMASAGKLALQEPRLNPPSIQNPAFAPLRNPITYAGASDVLQPHHQGVP
jgi:hypothetical protein